MIPPKFPVAIDTAFSIIETMDRTTVKLQAQPAPFSNPYATMKEMTPRIITTIPIAIAPVPISQSGTPDSSSVI